VKAKDKTISIFKMSKN